MTDIASINQHLQTDPTFQHLLQQWQSQQQPGLQGLVSNRGPLNQYLQQKYGIDPTQYAVDPGSGQVAAVPQDDLGKRLAVMAGVLGTVGTAGALGAFAPGALGAGGGAATGGTAAATTTGGGLTAGAALKGAAAVGQVASGIETARQRDRQAQTQGELEAARLNLQAPGMRAANSVRGDVLANAQPATVSGPTIHTHGAPPTITGGLSPALLSGNTRQLGQGMSRDALLAQMQGPITTPQPSGVDALLNGVGLAGLGGAAYSAIKPPANPLPFGSPAAGNPNLPYQPPVPFMGWQQ